MKYTVSTILTDIVTTEDYNEALRVYNNTGGSYVELKAIEDAKNYYSKSLLIKRA